MLELAIVHFLGTERGNNMTNAHYFMKGCFEHSNCVKGDLRIFKNWGVFWLCGKATALF